MLVLFMAGGNLKNENPDVKVHAHGKCVGLDKLLTSEEPWEFA